MRDDKGAVTMTIKQKDNSTKIFAVIFGVGVLSRILLLLIGMLILKILHTDKNLFEFMSQAGDVPHYISIAQNGYAAAGEDANKIVFYPLFPWLMRILHIVFRNYAVSGFVISYASFGAASAYLYKLMRLDYDSEKTADALLLMFIAPFGMFFISVHTESLFLMLSIMTLYYSRKENLIAAGICGFFAALTKTQGMLLVVPVVYELILCSVRDKKFKKEGLFALLIPAGFLIYLCINKAVQGDFFAYVEHQAAAPWYNTAKWVSDSIATSYNVGIDNYSLSLIIYFPQIILFFFSVALIFAGLYKRVRTSYLAFMGVYVLVTYLHGWMISGARYITSCAVIYIVMAAIDNKIIKYLMYLISGVLCLYMFTLWLLGYAIM